MPTDVESELVASLVRIGEGQTGSHEWATIVSLEDAGWGPHWVQPASWAPTSKIIKIMHSALGTRAHVPVCARVLAGRGIHLSEEEICSYTKQLKKKKPLLGPARDYGNGHMRSTSRLALLAVPASRLLLEEGDELGAQVAAAQDALLAAGAPPPPPPPSSEKVALADAEARARAAEKALAVERARARKAERAAERREKELQQELRDVREAAQEHAKVRDFGGGFAKGAKVRLAAGLGQMCIWSSHCTARRERNCKSYASGSAAAAAAAPRRLGRALWGSASPPAQRRRLVSCQRCRGARCHTPLCLPLQSPAPPPHPMRHAPAYGSR